MSLVHLELYESRKLDTLDFSSYLRKLIYDLIRLYRNENCNIQVNLNVNSFFLGVDTAVSLGIIINCLQTLLSMLFQQEPGEKLTFRLVKKEIKKRMRTSSQVMFILLVHGSKFPGVTLEGVSILRLLTRSKGISSWKEAGAQNLFSNSWVKSNAAAERVLQGIGKNQKEVD